MDLDLTEAQYKEHVEKLRKVSRDEGIDYILDKYDADVIIGPADSGLSSHASGSGKNLYTSIFVTVADTMSRLSYRRDAAWLPGYQRKSIRLGCSRKEASRSDSHEIPLCVG